MLRAALATAGVHEAPAPDNAQALLHPQGPEGLVRAACHQRFHLGGLPHDRP